MKLRTSALVIWLSLGLLFEPVIIGRTHVRQLILEADLQLGHPVPRDQGLEIREMNFTAATVAQMASFDLRKVALPAGLPVAIFALGVAIRAVRRRK